MTISRTTVESVAIVTINNPPVNAISADVLDGLNEAFGEVEAEQEIRAVVVTGTSDVFAVGADIPSFLLKGEGLAGVIQRGVLLFDRIEHLAKPVVAAISGHCLGGGLELALAMDLRVASEHARLGQPEVHWGIIPGWNGTVRLPRIVGRSHASDLILTGESISGRRAYEMGLVNRLADEGLVVETAINLARQLASQAPKALAAAKALLASEHDDGAAEREFQAVGELMVTQDAQEGVTAFMQKRRPNFQGR